MIQDVLQRAERYSPMHPSFSAAFAFLQKAIDSDLPVGRYDLDGTALYAFVQEYEGSESSDRFEGHENYIDIQFLLDGCERIEVAPVEACEELIPYDPEKDAAFYTCNDHKSVLRLERGEFAIFYPEDLHNPGLRCAEGGLIRKVVVRIRIS